MPGAVTYPLRVRPMAELRVDRLILGQSPEDAADLLPRLFNLCRAAQGVAARAAFGLPPEPGWQEALRADILREHVVKLCIKWPALLDMPPLALPQDWQTNAEALRTVLFGKSGALPPRVMPWLDSGQGVVSVLSALAARFAPGQGVRARLPHSTAETMFDSSAQENSAAARHHAHPLMAEVETLYGRGPLWSALGVLVDVDAVLSGDLPAAILNEGHAVVPAARGLYAVQARVDGGRVTAFTRKTPTDHLTAPGGALDQGLQSLPKRDLAPLLLSVMDPCVPLELEAEHA